LRLRLFLTTAALALQATAAQAAPEGERSALERRLALAARADQASLYGLYLAGRGALHAGDGRSAATYFDLAAAADPQSAVLKERAFTAALLAGEVSRASAIAGQLGAESNVLSLARLTQAAEALAEGKGKAADKILNAQEFSFPHDLPVALLKPWAAAAAGDWDRALASPPQSADRAQTLFLSLSQAQLLEMRRKYDDAETIYKAQLQDPLAAPVFRAEYGAFLERRGRREDAAEVYRAGAKASPAEADSVRGLQRVETNQKAPPRIDIATGAARALGSPAAAMIAARQAEFGMAYLRLALRLDPELHQGWLLLGEGLEAAGDAPAAREAWAKVPTSSPLFTDARARTAWSLYRNDDKAGAIRIMQEAAAVKPDLATELTLADLYRADERYEEALKALDAARAIDADDWRVFYMRGAVLERLGRWPEAEAELTRALELRPGDPEIQNYLGYAWIDRGVKVKEGLALVEKAVAAQPDSGAMIDSLGWAHFRLGDYAKALEHIEKAVELQPGDPEINDHLGDVYWRLGRQLEARFQWTRVLSLEPSESQKQAVEAKLKAGLPAQPRT
jgi:Flp pilus assembly protein TadD